MVMDDRPLTANHLDNNVMSISRERVENIYHKELGMSKVSARWALTSNQKLIRLVMSDSVRGELGKVSSRFRWFC